MSLDLALSIARSGLSHVNRQLAQSAANVANAATPGYTRKEVQGESNIAGSLPAGVRSGEATRAVDAALVTQMNAARATSAAAAARARLLEGVEVAHGAAGQSIGDLTAALGDAFVSLRANPADALLQSRTVSAAADLSARYNTVSGAIRTARQAAQDGMMAEVDKLNGALRQIAALNDQITPMRAQGMSTAELEDKRDAAIATVSSIIQVRSVPESNGAVMLITAQGMSLPLDPAKGPFSVANAKVGTGSFYGSGGSLPGVTMAGIDVTASLGNGSLGAYVGLRDRELPIAQAELDVSAASLAARFDAQGLRLFTDGTGTVPDPAAPYAGSASMGFASAIGVNPEVGNNSALVRDGTHPVPGGGATPFIPNGTGGPAAFTTLIDRVLEQSLGAEAAPGSPHPAFATTGLGPDGLLMSRLRPGATLAEQASQVVAVQTALRPEAEEAGKASFDLLGSLETRFAARSGVDMDKELAAMMTLQTAYAANARIISVVQSMYDTLLQAVR